MIAAHVVPQLPIRRQLSAEKEGAIRDMDLQVGACFAELRQCEPGTQDAIIRRIDGLLSLRGRIDSISTFPYAMRSVITVLSVAIITLLPTAVEWLIKVIVPTVRP